MANKKTWFDWSVLDRTSLANNFSFIKSEILSKELSVTKIHSILTKNIKDYYPIKIRKYYNKTIEKGVIYIGGMYYSDWDKENKKCIELQLIYNNPKDKIFIDNRRLQRMSLCFADTILHEIIHMRQFRRRKFKYLPDYESNAEKSSQRIEQSYLGSSDEIDAYAFNISCDLSTRFKNNQSRIVKYLDQNQKNKKRKFNCWRMYLDAFDHNHSHKIIKRLKKKVIRYLPHAAIGKPYKNKDWIHH